MTRQYIFTERAHLMCPNMYFGIVEVVNSPFDVAHIQCVFQKLSNSHPFLKALLGYEREKNQYYYDITDNSKTEITLKDVEVSSIQDQVIFDEYKKLTRRDWNLVYEGMLKVVCWKMKNRTCILFVFHHLLADGRAALGLAREFAQLYVRGREPKPVLEQLISSMNDLPIGSKLSTISKMLINKCNKNWLKESHIVTYDEYHAFANDFLQNDEISHLVQQYNKEKLDKLVSDCKENGVSVNDYLLAKMFIEEHTKKIIIAQDIRNKLLCYKEGTFLFHILIYYIIKYY